MGNGMMAIPYGQLHFAICLSRDLATDAPATCAGPLLHQVVNLLEGPGTSKCDPRAGTPWEGKDPKEAVPYGIIPALVKARDFHKLTEAARATMFAEHARDIAWEAIPRTDKPDVKPKPDMNEIRRAAKVVSLLLQAALATFP